MALQRYNYKGLICGTDEAGRGCLAGPVTAAAIILPENFKHKLLNDSKKIHLKHRILLETYIKKHALTYAVYNVNETIIDDVNILNASILAMQKAIDTLNIAPELIIVDGNKFKPYKNIPHKTIIKGDGKFLSIAAASVLAKTARDYYMAQLHKEFPMYNWIQNKGYPTKQHREAIKKYGPCKYHRKTFKLLPGQLRLNL